MRLWIHNHDPSCPNMSPDAAQSATGHSSLFTKPPCPPDLDDLCSSMPSSYKHCVVCLWVCVCVCVCYVMCAFLTIRYVGGHWLVIVGVATGDRPHRVAPIVMGTDKQVSSAFPHQALQLLQVVHTHKVELQLRDIYIDDPSITWSWHCK